MFISRCIRKLINETSQDFYEWVDNNRIKKNERVLKEDHFSVFKNEFEDTAVWLKRNTLTKWVKKYAETFGYKYSEGQSNSIKSN